jgi:hypothetical protein
MPDCLYGLLPFILATTFSPGHMGARNKNAAGIVNKALSLGEIVSLERFFSAGW